MGKKSAQKKPGMSKKSQPSAPLTKPEFKPLEEQGGWITTEQNKKYVQKDIYNDVITPGYQIMKD